MKLQIGMTPLIREIRETKTFRVPENLFLKTLLFVGIFYLVQFAESAAILVWMLPQLVAWGMEQIESFGAVLDWNSLNEMMTELVYAPENIYRALLITGVGTILVLLYCRFVEGRPLRTMGFRKRGALVQYLVGLLLGFLAFSLLIGIAYLMGGLRYTGTPMQLGMPILGVFIGFLVQGMSEEVICRGFMMTSILRHHNIWWAAGINAVVFALGHVLNPGFSLLACLNLILYAVMISLYVLRTDNLWGACAFHGMWNFAQGNFYGLPTSGVETGHTVISMNLTGSALANGGSFGLEASLGCTIVMLLFILVLLFVPNPFAKKQSPATAEVWA